jgi:hypothetical protein
VAVQDEVRAAPGKSVTVDATLNDLIARGDSVELQYKAPVNPEPELRKWKVDEANTYFTTKVPDVKAGVQHLTYGISNGLFDPSRSTISVVPDPNAKNPPVAVDDTAKPKQGETSALVDVLANDRDIDGTRASLTVSAVLSPDGTVESDGEVRVKVKPFPYTIPYVITDEDGLTAMALIYVPTGESGVPFVVSGALIEMDKNSTKSVKLSDYVKSPRARVVSITTADNVSASPADKLRVEADGRSGLDLTSSGDYIGPGAVMLEVSDQETVQQKDFKTTYVSIPVQIGPKIPLLRCPSYTVSLNAGGLPRTVDIPTLCHAWLPVGMTLDDVVFESDWKTEPKGVALTRRGTGNRMAELEADDRAPSSVNGRLVVKARGGPESAISVSVLGIDGGQVDADGQPLPTLGPPRLRPFAISGLEAGSSRTIDLNAYLDSPLETPKCSITAATAPAGSGLTVTRSGCDLTVAAAASARGRSSVDVVVVDGPARNAAGRGSVEILGKPDKPTGVAAEADRVKGGNARVRWVPPAVDGGSPITGYVVTVNGPGGGERRCSASPCTITGLENGESYTFTVAAVNAIGRSPEGGPSNAVKPDTLPNRVSGVRMAGRGDRTLDIAWSAPAKKGSDVTRYQLRVTDTTSGASTTKEVAAPALRTTVAGLVNDHQQSVQVRAKNDLGYGPFGPAVTMQSAGTPPAVPAPTVTNSGTGAARGSSALRISWSAVRPNGPPLTKYKVYESKSGGAWRLLPNGTVSPGTRSITHATTYDGATYRYVVTATNGANKEGPKANPRSFSSVGIPQAPDQPNVKTPDPNKSAVVRVKVNDSRSKGFTQLQWKTSVGRTGTVSCGCPEGTVKQFTITGLGTTSQTLQVRAYNGRNWSAWSQSSNRYQAFGPTPTPSGFTASRSGDNAIWTWSLPTNGRPITNVQYSGSFDGTAGEIRRLERDGAKGKTYKLRVRAKSAAGWSNWTAYRSVKIPNPTPSVYNVHKGPYRIATRGSGSCLRAPGCPSVLFDIKNFPGGGGGWDVTIFTGGGSADSGTKLYVNGAGNGYSWEGWIGVAPGNGPVSVRLCRSGTCHRSGNVSW